MNIILGGGDVGKTTILEAVGLLLSPSNTTTLSESDYWQRDTTRDFSIEAVLSLSTESEIGTQRNFAWPWHWDENDAVLPSVPEDSGDDLPSPGDPVYRVRVRGTSEMEVVWEIVQPNDEIDHFSVAVRRKIGLVRLASDDRNERDLRLVFGSALDRLFADSALRARIGQQVAEIDLNKPLGEQGVQKLKQLDRRLAEAALPNKLTLGLTTAQGISIGALIGLLANKGQISLPLASWGAGTRRMAALEIASSSDKEFSVTTIDEIERGLEPYRLRKFISDIASRPGQIFITTHSPVAIACAETAHLWYLDSANHMGLLPRDRIEAQQRRDPETFLAKVPVIAEGPTEVGFLNYLLAKAFGTNPANYGVRVCNGQGNPATLDLLETLSSAGLHFAALADNENQSTGRWQRLKQTLGTRLLQWPNGCTERHVINAIPEDRLEDLLRDDDGDLIGERLRTLAARLFLVDKDLAGIQQASKNNEITFRELIILASSGDTTGAPDETKKEWKKHGQHWFKSVYGGRELAEKMMALGAWPAVQTLILPLINSILVSAGRLPMDELQP